MRGLPQFIQVSPLKNDYYIKGPRRRQKRIRMMMLRKGVQSQRVEAASKSDLKGRDSHSEPPRETQAYWHIDFNLVHPIAR